jgi:hypothetical protein
MRKTAVIFIFLFLQGNLWAQVHNYWSYNFNEESSLIAGAVVGGGAGASAIFYNPATISEISTSKFSLNASLFSFDIQNAKNILGEGIDLKTSRFYAIPRSVSYMHKPRKNPNWSLEFAFMNVTNNQLNANNYTSKKIDIINKIPGEERYIAYTEFNSKYRNDYFGVGGSHILTKNLFVGVSMFLSANSKHSSYQVDINAHPNEYTPYTPGYENSEVPYYIASHTSQEIIRFNDYRLLWKFGLLYKQPRFSVGLNITTPSLGGIYSDGKRIMHKHSQSNISNPETGESIPDFLIMDYAEKKDVTVSAKSPFSIAAGCTYYYKEDKRVLYTTIEYFGGIDSYRLIYAKSTENLENDYMTQNIDFSDWLTYYYGAKPVFNVALGHRWYLKKNVMLLGGLKTDFSYNKKIQSNPNIPSNNIKSIDVDLYHLTTGLTVRILGQDITAGLQYSLGINKDKQQFLNLSDPVEFNFVELKALQGTRTNTVNTSFNSITILLAASFNFNNNEKKE